MATSRVSEAREALKHLPATESSPAELQKLAAWFALKRGDIDSERRALERLIAADPADFRALDRLVEPCAERRPKGPGGSFAPEENGRTEAPGSLR